MNGGIANVQISFPTNPKTLAALTGLYAELLGMIPYRIGYQKLAHPDGHRPEIGFENYYDDPQPRWPDPAYPQQVHLDIEVGDIDAAEEVVLRHGAVRLRDNGVHRIYADHAGHPFCLYEVAGSPPMPGRMARIVFDCFSPRTLARFYEDLLGMHTRVVDTPDRVVLDGPAGGGTMLGFQHAQFPAARWPEPAYPEQLHLDIVVDDPAAAATRVEAMGGIRLQRPNRPDALVYADPAAHPFCLGVAGS